MTNRVPVTLVLAAWLAGCQAVPRPRATVTTLYFGLGRADAAAVSPEQWEAFVVAEIVPKFPDGFTLLDGRGRWQERGVGYAEASRLLVVVHAGDRDSDRKLEALRRLYCRQFGQASVLRVDTAASRVAF
jgi:hypothetical protein